MAWIESHQELRDHPKSRRLARHLRVTLPQAIGHLHCLWWWAVDYATDGELSRYDAGDIADAALWEGEPEHFLEALVDAAFVDRDEHGMWLHDWHDYAGRLLEWRHRDAGRKREMRAAYKEGTIDAARSRDGDHCRYCGRRVNWNDRRGPTGGTYDHVVPDRPATVDNLVVCCRSCNSRKGGRSPEEAGMVLLPPRGPSSDLGRNQVQARTDLPTVPNRTVPNRTAPTTHGAVPRAVPSPETFTALPGTPVPGEDNPPRPPPPRGLRGLFVKRASRKDGPVRLGDVYADLLGGRGRRGLPDASGGGSS